MSILLNTLSNLVTKTFLSPFSVKNEIISYIPERFISLKTIYKRNIKRIENPVVKKPAGALEGRPFAKGVVLKTLIRKPRKPNSANRKCVLVKLSFGKELVAYVPGEGHNLQEHQTVLVKESRLKDTPGVKVKCVRGKYDLPHVKKKT